MTARHITRGTDAADGAGVKLKRMIGHVGLEMLDPSLLLNERSGHWVH